MTNAAWTEMDRLRATFATPGVDAQLTTFPSGCAMLDLRHGNRAFVMAYKPEQGFAVDELRPGDGFVSGYQFVSEDFEPAARRLRALADIPIAAATSPSLSLLVLQCADIEAATSFYSQIGLAFQQERHGAGPRHYSTHLGNLLLELYPCNGDKPAVPVRLGFRVASLDHTIEKLRARGARIVREPADSPWGRRAVVEDPDGNRIELTS